MASDKKGGGLDVKLGAAHMALASVVVFVIALAGCGGGASSPAGSGPPLDQPASAVEAQRFETQATFPAYGSADARGEFSSANQGNNGSMLPETSVDQYGATLARWFGLSEAQALDVFPHLARFDVSKRNLRFMT
jgi:hypothetical protein